MLGKLFVVMLWVALLTAIPSAISYYKKYSESAKAQRQKLKTGSTICIALTSALYITLFMICIFFPDFVQRMSEEDALMTCLTKPTGLFALFAMTIITLPTYYWSEKLKLAKAIDLGDLSDFENYTPSRHKPTRMSRRRKPMTSRRAEVLRTTSRTTSSRPVPAKDTSAAKLTIMSEGYEKNTIYDFNNIDDAKAYLATLEAADVIILTQHTVVISFNGYRSRENMRDAARVIDKYVFGKDCTIVDQRYHYLEFTVGLCKDRDSYSNVMDSFIANVDTGT